MDVMSPPETTTESEEVRQRQSGRLIAGVGVAVVVIAAAVLGLLTLTAGQGDSAAAEARIEELSAEVDDLRQQLDDSRTTTTVAVAAPATTAPPTGIPLAEVEAAARDAMPYGGIAEEPIDCHVESDRVIAPAPTSLSCEFLASHGVAGWVDLTVVERSGGGWNLLSASPGWVGD
jgi:hypothetical protein